MQIGEQLGRRDPQQGLDSPCELAGRGIEHEALATQAQHEAHARQNAALHGPLEPAPQHHSAKVAAVLVGDLVTRDQGVPHLWGWRGSVHADHRRIDQLGAQLRVAPRKQGRDLLCAGDRGITPAHDHERTVDVLLKVHGALVSGDSRRSADQTTTFGMKPSGPAITIRVTLVDRVPIVRWGLASCYRRSMAPWRASLPAQLWSALAWLLAMVVVLGWLGFVRAAAPHEATPPATSDPSTPIEERPRLLVLTDESELGFASERVIRTELNDVPVELEVVGLTRAADLRDRIAAAERLVGEHDALGAVWIETSEAGFDVYLVVAEAGMVQRPIVAVEGQDAALEAAAVVVRYFATDLLEGRAIGLRPIPRAASEVDAEVDAGAPANAGQPGDPREAARSDSDVDTDTDSEPPERTAWRLDAHGRFRMQVGYAGQAYAPQQRWSSGAELLLGFRARVGAHLGVAYTLSPAFRAVIEHPTSSGVAEVALRRHPLALVVGYQHAWARPRLALDAQVRGLVELVQRQARDPLGSVPLALDPALVVVPAVEPRVQLDWIVLPPLSVFFSVGVRIHAIDYRHGLVLEDGEGEEIGRTLYLEPNLVSPTLAIGLSLFL